MRKNLKIEWCFKKNVQFPQRWKPHVRFCAYERRKNLTVIFGSLKCVLRNECFEKLPFDVKFSHRKKRRGAMRSNPHPSNATLHRGEIFSPADIEIRNLSFRVVTSRRAFLKDLYDNADERERERESEWEKTVFFWELWMWKKESANASSSQVRCQHSATLDGTFQNPAWFHLNGNFSSLFSHLTE